MPNYNNQYLTLVAKGSGNFKFETSSNQTYSYSTNEGSTWVTGNSATTIAVNNGDRVMYKGTLTSEANNGIGRFSASTNFEAEGNPMSLLFGDNFINQTSLEGYNYAFYNMFNGCSTLTSIENLKLPATTLASRCYKQMFYYCTSLTTIPSGLLPATTLATYCYQGMFIYCYGITLIPSDLLLATTLEQGCYAYMFSECISLTSVPSGLLPATTLASHCYAGMFEGCTSLTTIPNLLATTLVSNCYASMFRGCTSLTTVPSGLLPATTLANNCYEEMFQGCTSLTSIPSGLLSTTTLAQSCYGSMFEDCTSLTTVPEDMLQATSLTSGCYGSMFWGCTSLEKAPILPATTLVQSCYYAMFYGCSSLNEITCLATSISATQCTSYWVNGVAASGTFYKAASMNDWTRSTSGIPVTWNVVDYYEPIYKWERITPVQGDPTTFICDECPAPQYRWTATTGYECSGTTKMTQEKKQVSYDSGETWTDVSPLETRAVEPVLEEKSTDCGYMPPSISIDLGSWQSGRYYGKTVGAYECTYCVPYTYDKAYNCRPSEGTTARMILTVEYCTNLCLNVVCGGEYHRGATIYAVDSNSEILFQQDWNSISSQWPAYIPVSIDIPDLGRHTIIVETLRYNGSHVTICAVNGMT